MAACKYIAVAFGVFTVKVSKKDFVWISYPKPLRTVAVDAAIELIRVAIALRPDGPW